MAVTWNPADKGANLSLSNSDLTVSSTANTTAAIRATSGKSSGHWYFEATIADTGSINIGIATASAPLNDMLGNNPPKNAWAYGVVSGAKYSNGSSSAYGAGSNFVGFVVGVELDLDAGTITFYRNGVSLGVAFSDISGTVYPAISIFDFNNRAAVTANFGATAFAYSVPSGASAYDPAASTDVPLSASLAGASSLSGALSVAAPLSAALVGNATLSGSLTSVAPLTSFPTASAILAGDLSVSIPLSAAPSASAALSGALGVDAPLAAIIAGSASLSGDLAVSAPLEAALSGSATLAGGLAVGVPLSATLAAGASLSADMALLWPLEASLVASATLSAELSVSVPLSANLSGAALLSAPLSARALVTDAQYRDWLSTEHDRCLLIEAQCWHDGAEHTVYLGNLGYISLPTDILPNQPYDAILASAPTITMALDSPLAIADIEVLNLDGELDAWLDWSWDGREISWWLGDKSWSRADFRQVFAGVIDSVAGHGPNTLALKIRDLKEWINRPLQVNLIAGGPNKGTEIPLCFGYVRNISPPLVDPAAVSITVLTAVGTTATAYVEAGHPYATGDKVFIDGADETVYNSTGPTAYDALRNPVPDKTVTVVDGNHFTYTLPSAAPTSPATGSIFATSARVHTLTSLTRSGLDATAYIAGGHPFTDGQTLSVVGAVEAAWNGDWQVTVPDGYHFGFTLKVAATNPATGAEVTAATGTVTAQASPLTYQIHDGAYQAIAQARDKGFPGIVFAADTDHGRLTTAVRPNGQLTVDAWGEVGSAGAETATVTAWWVGGMTWALADGAMASVANVRANGAAVSGWTADLPHGRVTLPSSAFTVVADTVTSDAVFMSVVSPVSGSTTQLQLPFTDAQTETSTIYVGGVALTHTGPDGSGVVTLDTPFPIQAQFDDGGVFTDYAPTTAADNVYTWTGQAGSFQRLHIGTDILVDIFDSGSLTPSWGTFVPTFDGEGVLTITLTINDLTGIGFSADLNVWTPHTGIAAAYVSGLTWHCASAFHSVSAVRANGVSVGFSADAGATTVTLADPPGPVTADITVYGTTAADIVRALVSRPVPDEDNPGATRPILPAANIDDDSLSAFAALVPAPIGYFVGNARINAVQALDEIMAAVGGHWGFSRTGKLRLWRLDIPAGTPVIELDADDVVLHGLEPLDTGLPATRQRVGCQRNYTVQDKSSLAGGVATADAQRYASPYLAPPGIANNAGVLGPHKAPLDPPLAASLYYRAADAQAEARRLADIKAVVRKRFKAEVFARGLGLDLGDVVRLTHPRYGFQDGALAVVVGIVEQPSLGKTTLTLWR